MIPTARDRFVWRWGVLGFGVTLAVVDVVVDEIVQGERLFASAGLSFAVRLLLSLLLMAPLAGIVWGRWVWGMLAGSQRSPVLTPDDEAPGAASG